MEITILCCLHGEPGDCLKVVCELVKALFTLISWHLLNKVLKIEIQNHDKQ